MTMLWRRRRLVLSLTLCLVVVLFATVALRTYLRVPAPPQSTPQASVATATPAVHSTFLFNVNNFPPAAHAGQQISLRWDPANEPRSAFIDADAATGPLTVLCTFALYGPYRSDAAASDAVRTQDWFSHPPMKPVFSAPPLSLTDWESEPQPVGVVLPTTLRPGFYVVVSASVRLLDGDSAGTATIAQIVS